MGQQMKQRKFCSSGVILMKTLSLFHFLTVFTVHTILCTRSAGVQGIPVRGTAKLTTTARGVSASGRPSTNLVPAINDFSESSELKEHSFLPSRKQLNKKRRTNPVKDLQSSEVSDDQDTDDEEIAEAEDECQEYGEDAPKRKHGSGSTAGKSKSNTFSTCTIWSINEESVLSAFLIRHLCRIKIVHIRKLADQLNRPVRATLNKAYTMQRKICERKPDKKWALKTFQTNLGTNLVFQTSLTSVDAPDVVVPLDVIHPERGKRLGYTKWTPAEERLAVKLLESTDCKLKTRPIQKMATALNRTFDSIREYVKLVQRHLCRKEDGIWGLPPPEERLNLRKKVNGKGREVGWGRDREAILTNMLRDNDCEIAVKLVKELASKFNLAESAVKSKLVRMRKELCIKQGAKWKFNTANGEEEAEPSFDVEFSSSSDESEEVLSPLAAAPSRVPDVEIEASNPQLFTSSSDIVPPEGHIEDEDTPAWKKYRLVPYLPPHLLPKATGKPEVTEENSIPTVSASADEASQDLKKENHVMLQNDVDVQQTADQTQSAAFVNWAEGLPPRNIDSSGPIFALQPLKRQIDAHVTPKMSDIPPPPPLASSESVLIALAKAKRRRVQPHQVPSAVHHSPEGEKVPVISFNDVEIDQALRLPLVFGKFDAFDAEMHEDNLDPSPASSLNLGASKYDGVHFQENTEPSEADSFLKELDVLFPHALDTATSAEPELYKF